MICRRLKKVGNTNHLVWFGSYGKNVDGTAKFYNPDNKHDNYADKQQGVSDALTQELSIIQQELWYNVSYGLPLLEKTKNKVEIDVAAMDIIMSHPDVKSIKDYTSEKIGHNYQATTLIESIYGDITLEI